MRIFISAFYTVILMVVSMPLLGQDTIKASHYFSVEPNSMQIRERANYGKVFSGVGVAPEYIYTRYKSIYEIQYRFTAGFSTLFNEGKAYNLSVQPLNLAFNFEIPMASVKHRLWFGPLVLAGFHWQMYPEVQSCHMFWVGSYSLGAQTKWQVAIKKTLLILLMRVNLRSLVSQPAFNREEEYFYSLRFSDFVRNAHTDMQNAITGEFTHAVLRLEYRPNVQRGFSLYYHLELLSDGFQFKSVAHGIGLGWQWNK